jgi:hypothetical protein
MKAKLFTVLLVVGAMSLASVQAQDTLFGEVGSGQPTKTVIGILGGAAAGAALGEGLGGHDGWWIGALTGSTIGGLAGNQWGAADAGTLNATPVRYSNYTHHTKARPHRRYYRVVEERPVVVHKTVERVVEQKDGIPYGYLESGRIRSPWSDFAMSVGGKSSGQILYDPNTGQAFRVP